MTDFENMQVDVIPNLTKQKEIAIELVTKKCRDCKKNLISNYKSTLTPNRIWISNKTNWESIVIPLKYKHN